MVQCRRSGICCLSIESRVAVDRHKNGMLIMCMLTCARASTGRRQARVPTIESRSVNGRGGQAEEQVLWWRQIWLLSTSAFLNTRSYLPSPLEKRSFLFFFLLLPLPSLSFLPSLPSRLIYLVPTSPFILHSLIFQFFFSRSLWCVIFTFTPLLTIHSFLFLLSMEQPIQQQNKAAWSITRWLIKQDQNSAAVRPALQNQDTGERCWSGEVGGEKAWGGQIFKEQWCLLKIMQVITTKCFDFNFSVCVPEVFKNWC